LSDVTAAGPLHLADIKERRLRHPRLSWYVHFGLRGFLNLKAETFNMLAGNQNKLAGECYIVP
jgi:hypothetical protein